MNVQENQDFEFAYKKYFGDGTEFAARDVSRYLTAQNADGTKINNQIDWIKNMVKKDPQFLSRSPPEQFEALKRAGYKASQIGPWPLNMVPSLKARQTSATEKGKLWSADFDDWGSPILNKYAAAIGNPSDNQTTRQTQSGYLKSSANLLILDTMSVNWALLQLSSTDQSVFSENLKNGSRKLKGFTWQHADQDFGRLLLMPTKTRKASAQTGWDSVLQDANTTNIVESTKQRALDKSMDSYSAYEKGSSGATKKSGTSSSTGFTSMTDVVKV
jgi:hypothetical protein